MNSTKIKIIQELKSKLSESLNDNLQKVVLFGSQLGENAHESSDNDIIIVLKKRYDWKLERQISDICYEIDLKYGIITDAHILDENDLNSPRGKQPIFLNALVKGISF